MTFTEPERNVPDSDRASRFSLQIRKARGLSLLSQERFAVEVGVSSRTLRDWEKGIRTPTLEQAQRIADLADVSLGWLIGDEAA